MNTLFNTRPRVSATPAGKSGHRTLELPTLIQDKAAYAASKAADRVAFLAAGGLQEPTLSAKEAAEQGTYFELFNANDWNAFAAL